MKRTTREVLPQLHQFLKENDKLEFYEHLLKDKGRGPHLDKWLDDPSKSTIIGAFAFTDYGDHNTWWKVHEAWIKLIGKEKASMETKPKTVLEALPMFTQFLKDNDATQLFQHRLDPDIRSYRTIEEWLNADSREAINYACKWSKTPEKHDFWEGLHDKWKKKLDSMSIPDVKELTVEEISKKLGYTVKVVKG